MPRPPLLRASAGRLLLLAGIVSAIACDDGRRAGSPPDRQHPSRGGEGAPVAWERGPSRLEPGDLLIVDADGGVGTGEESRCGLVLLSRPVDGAPGPLLLLTDDPALREPLDVAVRSPTRLLILESKGVGAGGDARGGLYELDLATGLCRPWWTDPRTRQPVGLAVGADGRVYVADRAADPSGLGRPTGAVFVIARTDGGPGTAVGASGEGGHTGDPGGRTVAVLAGPELVTPATLLATRDGRLLLMDADANPHGYQGTPGVLFEIRDGAFVPLLEPSETTSPLGLVERGPGEIFLIDCNEGRESGVYADGALFRVTADGLIKLIDSYTLGRPRGMHDPTLGDTLEDGRLVVADVSADPLGLGEDGSQGFMGSGPGAILVVDPDAGTVEPWIADARFVSPISVRRVRP